MAKVVNNMTRPVHLMGVMLVPGVETEVPDEALELKGFQDLFESDDISMGEKPAAKTAAKPPLKPLIAPLKPE